MIKLNRATEYALIALRYMSKKHALSALETAETADSICVSEQRREVTSAREISDHYQLPFEITAKTLQRLKETGIIESAHGARGGYRLRRLLPDVSLAEFLELMEGPQSVVVCAPQASVTGHTVHSGSDCEYGTRCEIKSFMGHLNSRVIQLLSGIHLGELESSATQSVHFPKENYQTKDAAS
jgi:Rrf2 family protein